MNLGPDVSVYKDKIVGLYGGKFLPFHNGHLKCIKEAAKQCDVLFVVVSFDDEWDKQLCEGTKFEWVNAKVRERWISEEVRFNPNIRVLRHYEKRSDDYMNDESVLQSNIELREKVGGHIDICFSSEPSYTSYFEKMQPGAKHIILDADRDEVNISATEIRKAGVYALYHRLPNSVQKHYVKRVCIVGTESTGKTTLAKQLAEIYRTNWVPEYGRTFYENLGGCYDIMERQDLCKIVIGHNHQIELAAAEANKVLFIDTDNIYTQFFVHEQFLEHDAFIEQLIEQNLDEIDLYIYLHPSVPHELDGMRRSKSEQQIEIDNKNLYKMYTTWYGKEVHEFKVTELDGVLELIDNLFSKNDIRRD